MNRLRDVEKYGQNFAEFAKDFNIQLVRNILKDGSTYGIHFFTLNRYDGCLNYIQV